MKKALVGTRIREQRRSKGMTQAALAGLSEISPSYLNLIEHNKRSVAGRVLISIAKALEVSPSDLTEGIESQVLSELQEAAASQPDVKPETDSIEELIGRFPGWSRLVANLFRQIRDQDKTIEALSDRLTHDPFLGENMHAMLTNVTAIGSTASILNSIEDMPDLRRQRFLRNIEDDATRLSEAVRELTAYFDHSADREPGAATPEEELDHWLARNAYHFPLLDELPVAEDARAQIEEVVEASTELSNPGARKLANDWLSQYREDAVLLPLERFADAARDADFNPSALTQGFSADMFAVFRRLSTLSREGIAAPSFGLIISNAAGQSLYRRPSMNFAIPRHGSACSLWPLYGAFAQPGQPLRHLLSLPNGDRYAAFTYAAPHRPAEFAFEGPVYMLSAMLFLPEDLTDPLSSWLELPRRAREIGASCRICTRTGCEARFEQRILPSQATE